MEELLVSEQINQITLKLNNYKSEETHSDEALINKFLDNVLKFHKYLTKYKNDINQCVDGMEKLSWLEISKENDLKSLKNLLTSSIELHRLLVKNYIGYRNSKLLSQVANSKIKEFKTAIDDLKEVTNDLNLLFFDEKYINDISIATQKNCD